MDEQLFANADWSALVPAGSAEARYGIQAKDAKRLGLLARDPDEPIDEPAKVLTTANLLPVEQEPDAKEAPKPADKAQRKPPTK